MEVTNSPKRNNLTTFKPLRFVPDVPEGVLKNQPETVKNYMSKAFFELEEMSQLSTVLQCIAAAEFDSGRVPMDARDRSMLAKRTVIELKQSHPTIAVDEFKTAFRLGSLGSYGQVYAINIAAIMSWVKAYVHDEERREQVQEFLKKHIPAPEPKPTPNPREHFRSVFLSIVASYQKFIKTGVLIDLMDMHFIQLEGLGLINIPVNEKAEIRKLVTQKLYEFKAGETHSMDRYTRKLAMQYLEEMEKNPMPQNINQEIKSRCRNFILSKFYSNVASKNPTFFAAARSWLAMEQKWLSIFCTNPEQAMTSHPRQHKIKSRYGQK